MRLSRRLLALSRTCYRMARDHRAVNKGETYRYRDGSVPFLRNIRNIGAGGFLFGAYSLKAFERRASNANQCVSDQGRQDDGGDV